MKFQKNIIIYFLIFYQLCFVINKKVYEGIDTWTPELLYEYAKQKYFSINNQENVSNIEYMIIDPENYLKNANLSGIINKMESLYGNYNVSTYIILISHLQTYNSNINAEVERFTSYFNYMIYKDNMLYNDNYALTTVFFLKDRKMRMRTGRLVREKIPDKLALNLLRNRKDNLRRENYYGVVNELLEDIYDIYEGKSKNSLIKNIIDIILIIILCIFFYFPFYICYINVCCPSHQTFEYHIDPTYEKISNFLTKNKNKIVKEVFNESCIICLNDFKKEQEKSENEKEAKILEEHVVVLNCGHKYHRDCLQKWRKENKKCPLCRREIILDEEIKNDIELVNIQNNSIEERENSIDLNFENERLDNNYIFCSFLLDISRNRLGEEMSKRRNINYGVNEKYDYKNSDDDKQFRSFHSFDNYAGGATDDW